MNILHYVYFLKIAGDSSLDDRGEINKQENIEFAAFYHKFVTSTENFTAHVGLRIYRQMTHDSL